MKCCPTKVCENVSNSSDGEFLKIIFGLQGPRTRLQSDQTRGVRLHDIDKKLHPIVIYDSDNQTIFWQV